jgi:hypothetical protein
VVRLLLRRIEFAEVGGLTHRELLEATFPAAPEDVQLMCIGASGPPGVDIQHISHHQ